MCLNALKTRQKTFCPFCKPIATHIHVSYMYIILARWYRAPELLYGARQYDEGVDLW